MHKVVLLFVACILLCNITTGSAFLVKADENQSDLIKTNNPNQDELTALSELFSKYAKSNESKDIRDIFLPWISQQTSILEWWIQIEYNDETFQKKVPVSITDFDEKFLKHPEYGEKITFNIDDDAEEDLEVIAGFYWSIIKDEQGRDVKSLEKRIRVRQLESGNYISNQTAEFQVWSELHVNYGLIKKQPYIYAFSSNLQNRIQSISNLFDKLKQIINQFSLIEIINNRCSTEKNEHQVQLEDTDHFRVGTGYRSPIGEDIPRYAEKRFAIAREQLFSPSLFQHQMDPGSSEGKGPFEVLYGFKAYKQGSQNPSYDIEFSIQFNPAFSLKTKFIASKGQICYHFDESSQQQAKTAVTFTSNILSGVAEDVELMLSFDEIDETLGQSGRWMTFDIDLIGDQNPIGGKFHYGASHIFDIDILVNSPLFEEKIEFSHIPKSIDMSWDLNFSLIPKPILYANAQGFVNLSMSSSLGTIKIYYPKINQKDPDQLFLHVPK